MGTARTLQCCDEKPCWKGCAWYLLQTMLEQRGHRAGSGQQAMFPNSKAFESRNGVLLEGSVRDRDFGPFGQKNGCHGICEKRHGHPGSGLSRPVEVVRGSDVCRRSTRNNPGEQRLGYTDPGSSSCPQNPKQDHARTGDERNAEPSPWPSCRWSVGRQTQGLSTMALWVKSTDRRTNNPIHLVTNADWSSLCQPGPRRADGHSQRSLPRFLL